MFGTALGAGATLIAVGNWWAFFASLSGRTRISFVPLVGGGLGAVATFTFWLADAPSWCVAGALSTVLLDWGERAGTPDRTPVLRALQTAKLVIRFR